MIGNKAQREALAAAVSGAGMEGGVMRGPQRSPELMAMYNQLYFTRGTAAEKTQLRQRIKEREAFEAAERNKPKNPFSIDRNTGKITITARDNRNTPVLMKRSGGARQMRGQQIKAIMAKLGLKLGAASKYLKENGPV
jgi:hypothetical protein